jgi:hypothetical protein
MRPSERFFQKRTISYSSEFYKKNFEFFDDNVKLGFEKLINFYVKNKDFFDTQNDLFLFLLNSAEIDLNVKNFFLDIIN